MVSLTVYSVVIFTHKYIVIVRGGARVFAGGGGGGKMSREPKTIAPALNRSLKKKGHNGVGVLSWP